MRRPLKPFVTEYKGAARRQSSPTSQPLKIDSEPAAPRQPELRPLEGSRAVPPPQEDSYEAALRAADALFAAPPRSDAAPRPTPPPKVDDPWADDSWADTQPLETQPLETAPTPPAAGGSSPPNGGRILRVLDEPPSPELLRLEAERAPKRRGRKPGSKNKPKPAPLVEATIPVDAPPRVAPVPVSAIAEVGAPETVTTLRPQLYRLPAARPASESARDEKYAWVRTKLKPGERWKRRLPKVAW